MASALPRAAALALVLLSFAPLLSSAQSPISLPPSSAPTASADGHLHPDAAAAALAPSQPPSDDEAALSPPAPPKTSPFAAPSESPAPHYTAPAPASLHSTASASAPSAPKDDEDDDKGDEKKERPSPAPAPVAEEIKAAAEKTVDGESERHGGELNGGKKAGVVVGAFTAAAVVGLAAVVWRKRQANIRRSRYADYSARLELV